MFSSEWENVYQDGEHLSVWPWSELISLFKRYVDFKGNSLRVLELGCGAGANIPFFLALGADYHAIEGSKTIVSQLHERFPNLKNKIVVGDFCRILPAGEFDVIVDRGALTCNSLQAITDCLRICHDQLIEGGKYIGVDWFSTTYPEFRGGVQAEDEWTRTGYTAGNLANIGRIHFSDKEHLLELFSDFEMMVIEYKTIARVYPDVSKEICTWKFVARK